MRKNEKITALYERLSRDDFGKDDDHVVIILYGGKIDLCRSIFAYIFYKDIELNFSPLQRLK